MIELGSDAGVTMLALGRSRECRHTEGPRRAAGGSPCSALLSGARRHSRLRLSHGIWRSLPCSRLGRSGSRRLLCALRFSYYRHIASLTRSAAFHPEFLCSSHTAHLSALLRCDAAAASNVSDLSLGVELELADMAFVPRELCTGNPSVSARCASAVAVRFSAKKLETSGQSLAARPFLVSLRRGAVLSRLALGGVMGSRSQEACIDLFILRRSLSHRASYRGERHAWIHGESGCYFQMDRFPCRCSSTRSIDRASPQ